MSVVSSTEGDCEFERRQLESATEHLEEAYSIACKLKHPKEELFTIQLLLTLLAVRRGSWAYAQKYFQECMPKFKQELELETAIIECLREVQHDYEQAGDRPEILCIDESWPSPRPHRPKGMAKQLLFEYVGRRGIDALKREIELLGLAEPPAFYGVPYEQSEQARAAHFKPKFVAAIARHEEERRRLGLFLEASGSSEV